MISDRLKLVYDLVGSKLGAKTDLSMLTQKRALKTINDLMHKTALQEVQTALQTKKLLQIALPEVQNEDPLDDIGTLRISKSESTESNMMGGKMGDANYVVSQQAELIQTGLSCL